MALQIPGYVIHREIGAGGMAKVFLATQTSLDRQVALKVMSPALATDPTFAKRFQREARTIAGLTHPNIVAVYEVGSVQHMHFFAMQHLAGGDLAGKLRRGIPEPEVVRIVCGVARALGFAHSRGVVHRDVTPGNILFDSTDNPVLTDFGIARSQQGSTRITHTGVSIGTSSYMSPEQARGGEVDARSDLYSLGALLFESLAGKPPYTGADGFAVAYAHVFEPIPRLPAGLEHWQPVIDRAMAKSPEDRFGNSEEMIATLQQVPVNAQRMLPVAPRPERGSMQSGPVEPVRPAPVVNTAANQAATLPAGQLPQIPTPPAEVGVATQKVMLPVVVPAPASAPAPAPSRPFRPNDGVVVSNTAETEIPPRRGMPAAALVAMVVVGVLLVAGGISWSQGWWPFARTVPVIVVAPEPPKPVSADPVVEPPKPVRDPVVTTDPATDPGTNPGTDPAQDPAGDPPPVGNDLVANVDLVNGTTTVNDPAMNPDGTEVDPDAPPVVEPFVGPPTRAEFVRPILDAAAALLKKGNLTTPPRSNSYDVYRYVLALDPGNAEARQGLLDTAKAIEKLALEAYAKPDLLMAKDLLAKADMVVRVLGPKEALITVLADYPKQWLETRRTAALAAEERWASGEAEALYREMLVIDPQSTAAAEGLKRASVLGKPGYRFRDALKIGGEGPQMVVVAPGQINLKDERGGGLAVKLQTAFAMGLREVSVAEFRAFVRASGRIPGGGKGCNDKEGLQMFSSRDRTWEKPGHEQSEKHPVTCISAIDAEAYAKWLSEQTGHKYRLPSEPQWWLAAGTLTLTDCKRGNFGDAKLGGRRALGCDDGFARSAPVGSFPAGANGLFDMAGNVREWTADCFLKTVSGRSATEAPWTSGNCSQRLILGSAWLSGTDEEMAIPRVAFKPQDLNNTVGFRVVMELP